MVKVDSASGTEARPSRIAGSVGAGEGCNYFGVRGHAEKGTWGWLIAVAPGAFVSLFEGLVWAVAAATNSEGPAGAGVYFFAVGLLGAIAAPILIFPTRQRAAWMWAVISLCVSFLGLGPGFLFWWMAALASCVPDCL